MSQSEFVQRLRIAIFRGALSGIALAGITVFALHVTHFGVPSDEITVASYGSDEAPLSAGMAITYENVAEDTVQVAFRR